MEKISQQSIKYSNLKRTYSLISKNVNMSRARLAEITKLSKTTTSALVDELIAMGYVVDSGIEAISTLGRKPSLIVVDKVHNFVGVVAWHSHRLIAALVNTAGEITFRRQIELADDKDYIEQTRAAVENLLVPAANGGRILGVCVVAPAMIDRQKRQIVSTVMQLEQSDKAVDKLRDAIKEYPLAILNDTACYAYAECVYSRIQKTDFAFININKGVGAVLVSKGSLLRGANGMTTQFGHYSLDRNGVQCSCGGRGCLETMVGEIALVRRAEECGALDILPSDRPAWFRDLGELAEEENDSALRLVELLAGDLAFALSNLIAIYHPQLIVIGGIGKNLGGRYLEILGSKVREMSFPQFADELTIRYAFLDEWSELQGAAQYYMDHHFSFDGEMKNKLFLE